MPSQKLTPLRRIQWPRWARRFQGSPPDNDNILHGLVTWGSSQLSQTHRPPRAPLRSAKIILMPPAPQALTTPRLQLCSFVAKRVALLPSTLSNKRVRVTQGFLCISPKIALDKTPSTNKKKFCIGRLTLIILNPSSLMLIKLQKSLTSIDFFKKVMARKNSKEGWRGRMMTSLLMHSSPYALVSLLRLCTNQKNIPLRYLSEIVHLSRHVIWHPRLL